MTQHIEPCPKCGAEVRRSMGFNESEDVRWAEYECDCGLSFYAESRIVDENGVHDDLAEYGDLLIQWNTRAERTCEITPYENTLHYMAWLCSECNNPTITLTHKPCFCAWCGAKAVV